MSKERMKFSDMISMSREIADTVTTEKFGASPMAKPVRDTKKSDPSEKMPYGAIWLTTLLVTITAVAIVFGIAAIAGENFLWSCVAGGVTGVFGFLTYKSIGWTDRV